MLHDWDFIEKLKHNVYVVFYICNYFRSQRSAFTLTLRWSFSVATLNGIDTTTVVYWEQVFCCVTWWWWWILTRANLSGMFLVVLLKGLAIYKILLVDPAAIHWAVFLNNQTTCWPLFVCVCIDCVCVTRQWHGVHGRERWSLPVGDGKMESWESGTQSQGFVWLLPTQIHRCLRLKV